MVVLDTGSDDQVTFMPQEACHVVQHDQFSHGFTG